MSPRTFGGRPFTEVRTHPERLDQPAGWRKPRRIFVCSMSDLFHEDIPDGFIVRVLLRMYLSPQHTFQVLTKRPTRMRDFMQRWAKMGPDDPEPKMVNGPAAVREAHPFGRGQLFADMLDNMGDPPEGAAYPIFDWMEGPRWWPEFPANVWFGVSAENQITLDERVPVLMQTPAALHFLSLEPLLGYLYLRQALAPSLLGRRVGWAIVGGESGGHGARDCYLADIESVVRQCRASGVPVFVKQLGTFPVFPLTGRVKRLKDKKGGNPEEWPAHLRVREWPRITTFTRRKP